MRNLIFGNWRRFFLLAYFFLLFLGLIMNFLALFSPILIYCSDFFGEQACMPIGVILIVAASIPGYLAIAGVLPRDFEIGNIVSIILVVVISALIYFTFGYLIDKIRARKLTLEQKTVYLVLFLFMLLVLVFLFLYNK